MNVKRFAGFALIGLALTGCQSKNSLTGINVPYGKETQLAYFEGQGHLLKGDLEDAYASFLSCAESEPEEMAFHYQLGKIDLTLERFEAAELHLNRALGLDPRTPGSVSPRPSALGQGNGAGAGKTGHPL